jgi:hypothetical protein
VEEVQDQVIKFYIKKKEPQAPFLLIYFIKYFC